MLAIKDCIGCKCWYNKFRGYFLPPCRVVTVTTMEISTTLETTVFGGVLRRTMIQTRGTVT